VRALRAVFALALACSGCLVLGRESYTTMTGEGAAPIPAADRVPVDRDRSGPGFAQDPVAVRAGGTGGSDGVIVSVCDWSPGFWIPVFPPIPVPILARDEQPGEEGTALVRITFEGKANWRATFSQIALVGPDDARATPVRYRIVLADKSESLAEGSLEPCARSDDPKTSVDRAKVAVLEGGELWLLFETADLPKGPLALELGGLTRNDARVPIPRLELRHGSRWYWYRAFP
jgi:hypothetical protein